MLASTGRANLDLHPTPPKKKEKKGTLVFDILISRHKDLPLDGYYGNYKCS